MRFESYKGSIKLGAGLTPASEGFPLMQSCDIQIDENGKTLAEYIENGIDSIEGLQDALDGLQKRNDESLKTEDKTIVGAINEVNSKTVDKTALIDAWAGEKTGLVVESIDGINWTEQFTLFDKNQNPLSSGEMALRIPLAAGENVTFEVDEENQVVKINATGGGSNDSVVGTWVFNSAPSFDGVEFGTPYYFDFSSNGASYTSIIFENQKYGASGDFISYIKEDDSATTAYSSVPVVWLAGGWDGEGYKTIKINNELEEGWFKTWLKANATKLESSCTLPSCDSSNEGQFLRVIDGIPTWSSVPNAEDNVF